MSKSLDQKSSVEEIKRRFDNDVARFSNLETGQSATIDAPLAMELIAQAAVKSTGNIRRVLDIGCGAGNNTIKLLQYTAPFDCDLVDLSLPMLEKAHERISLVNSGKIKMIQGDFRKVILPDRKYDVILAAAVFHHLRDDQDWETAFHRLYSLTAPGGSVWITDLVSHEAEAVQSLMWQRYGEYLYSFILWEMPTIDRKYLDTSRRKIRRGRSLINWICFGRRDSNILTFCTKILALQLLARSRVDENRIQENQSVLTTNSIRRILIKILYVIVN